MAGPGRAESSAELYLCEVSTEPKRTQRAWHPPLIRRCSCPRQKVPVMDCLVSQLQSGGQLFVFYFELEKLGLGDNVQLKIMELPVQYSEVEKKVNWIWTELQPQTSKQAAFDGIHFLLFFVGKIYQLSVHVGMSASSKAIALEQCGRNKGYMEGDLSGAHPQGGCCLLEGPERIESAVNMKSVCKNISCPGVDVIHSSDAGSMKLIINYTTVCLVQMLSWTIPNAKVTQQKD
ncbi:unnamed protein product [Ranitomeya imitator]|uniref:Uncharacterized protein n=1 Tax=Ranitomeya imitator TaxID=111125 RepID=A0ABN9L112_9NEOB|nr:unnamed protein product [Ranitomeya imitator]